MFSFTDAQFYGWLGMFIWPLTRILGLISAAPIFGHTNVPATSKIGISIFLTLIVAPTLTNVPILDPATPAGLLILLEQLIIGLAMGFAMRMVFVAIDMAGAISAMSMGFGFASFYDPQTQGQTSAISQFFTMLATLIFLSINGHLMIIETLVSSFTTLPISLSPNGHGFMQLANWGGFIFSTGVQLAMPMIAALLITNIALGILTRSAPQLNIFGIGFPITLSVGFLVIITSLPYLTTPIIAAINQTYNFAQRIFLP
jgi:flagellar biosynthetic protein FliR